MPAAIVSIGKPALPFGVDGLIYMYKNISCLPYVLQEQNTYL